MRKEARTFRMDRIRSSEVLAERVSPRDVDLSAAARGYSVDFVNPFGNSDITVSPRG
jgi:hypothetical protein